MTAASTPSPDHPPAGVYEVMRLAGLDPSTYVPPVTSSSNTTPNTEYALELFVAGKPAPQGPKRHVGAGVMVESSKAVGPWRTVVAWSAAQAYRGAPLDGAVWVSLLFVMPRPAATPKRSTPQAIKRPDLDKLTRACFDALSGVVWRDDSQVIQLVASKRLAQLDEQPGVHIRVRLS